MYIEVYADILFLICLIPEWISLLILSGWNHVRLSVPKLALLSAVSALLSTAALLMLRAGIPDVAGWDVSDLLPAPVVCLALDLAIQAAVFRVAFGKRKFSRTLSDWGLQKIFFLLAGGLLQTGLKQGRSTFSYVVAGLAAAGLAAGILVRRIGKKKGLEQNLYEVELFCAGRCVRCIGLLDTGNQLYCGGTHPVVLLAPELAEKLGFSPAAVLSNSGDGEEVGTEAIRLYDRYRLITYRSVGKEAGVLHGFVCDRIRIRVEGMPEGILYEKPVAAVSEHTLSGEGLYQMLLHPALFHGRPCGPKTPDHPNTEAPPVDAAK